MRARSKCIVIGLAINMLIPTATLAFDGTDTPDSTITPRVTASPSNSKSDRKDSKAESKSQRVKADPAKLCENATQVRSNLIDDSAAKGTKLQENFAERSQKLVDKRTELTQKIAINRTKADIQRTQKFAELDAKAKTPEQKLAVENYKTAVLAAIKKHRSDIDSADKVFLDKLIASITDRQKTMLDFNKLDQSAISLAMSQAKASCAAGIPVKTVRQNLKAALSGIQDKFKELRKTANKVNPDGKTLKSEHQAAIKVANEVFRTSLKQALTALKAALKGTNESPDPSKSTSPSPSAVPAL